MRFVNHFEARTAFDEPFMMALGERVKGAVKAGEMTMEEARYEFGVGIMAHFGLKTNPDSFGAQILIDRALHDQTLTDRALVTLADFTPPTVNPEQALLFDDAGTLLPEPTFADIADDVITRNTNPLALRAEVPHALRPLPTQGMARYVGRALKESESTVLRNLARPFEIPSAAMFRVHQDASMQIERAMRDFGPRVYSASEIRAMKVEVADIINAGNPEDTLGLMKRYTEDGAKRYVASKNMPADLGPAFADELTAAQDAVNAKRIFGVMGDRSLRDPALETQLANEVFFVPPKEIKRIIDRYSDSVFNLRGAYATGKASRKIEEFRALVAKEARLAKTAGGVPLTDVQQAARVEKLVKEEARKLVKDIPMAKAFDRFDKGREMFRAAVRFWKFSVVPRPGYIGRVILLDENTRFLATTGSLFERMAALNIEESTAALMRGYLTVPNVTPLVSREGAALVGRGVDKTLGRAIDAFWPDEEFTIVGRDGVETVLKRPRPGRIDNEAMAGTSWRESELMDDLIRQSSFLDRMGKSEHYGRVVYGDKQYFQVWAHNLKNQLGFSDPGRAALSSVMAGDSVEDTANVLRAFAARNKEVMERIGVSDVDAWANDLASMTHAYTMGSKDIAGAALARADGLEQMLRGLKAKETHYPAQHGPLMESLTGAKGSLDLKRYVDYWYDTFVRMPENTLNRQPYYKVWKQRAERALEMNHEGPIDEAARKAIDLSSRDFALAQVKRIMFDFTESTRLGEAIGAVVPFMQPWLEAYSVWGHIIMHRNPAMIGYLHQLGRFGVESGFLRHDPATGELMVPMSWWLDQSLIYDAISGTKGMAAYTPISAANLFFSSSIQLPKDGVAGDIFGGQRVRLDVPVGGDLGPARAALQADHRVLRPPGDRGRRWPGVHPHRRLVREEVLPGDHPGRRHDLHGPEVRAHPGRGHPAQRRDHRSRHRTPGRGWQRQRAHHRLPPAALRDPA
jgi:hypothetical protein